MLRSPIAWTILLCGVAACSSATEPFGDCAPVVLLDGRYYEYVPELAVPDGYDPGGAYATVSRRADCVDVLEDGQPVGSGLSDGESTFLEGGTELYPVDGFDPSVRLAARHQGAWIVLDGGAQPLS